MRIRLVAVGAAASASLWLAPVVGSPADPCGPGDVSLGPGSQPAACWRPYAAGSPFNRPIPPNPPLDPHSGAIVHRVLGFGRPQNLLAGTAGRGELDGGRPIYFSRPGDPVFKPHCTEHWGRCTIEGALIRIPDRAQPAGGSDAHLTVIDPASGWEYDFWGVSSKPGGGGTLVIRWGGKTRVDGSGLGSDAVAAQYGTAAGVLRAEELASGQIDHALFMTVKCDSGRHVYPATKHGSPCSSDNLPNTDAPAEGTRFQLAMSDGQISALSVPDWKKVILRAMARYGMIVGDTGGTWGIGVDSGVVYTSFGQPDRWVTLAQQWGVPYYAGDRDYIFDLGGGVEWGRYLRVVSSCVSRGSCGGGSGGGPGPPHPGASAPLALRSRGAHQAHGHGRGHPHAPRPRGR
ncbi:MAG TPA: hypothetical protein VGY97_12820 [Solirubrobacteraceae bacterium]|nr:hypothetical protein [Solirubrobacteraceae bacterium]